MDKAIVVYKSLYGNSKRYAKWIGEELNCPVFKTSKLNLDKYKEYDTVIIGGGIYTGDINGVRFFTTNFENFKDKNIIVFTVGIMDPEVSDQFKVIIDHNFSKEMQKKIKFFHLRGDLIYRKLNPIHKLAMSLLRKALKNKPESERTPEDIIILGLKERDYLYTKKENITPLVEYVKWL